MGLRLLDLFTSFSAGNVFVRYRRRILTSNDGPCTERVKVLITFLVLLCAIKNQFVREIKLVKLADILMEIVQI